MIVNSYKIEPYADLQRADLSYADLSYADLQRADLSFADLGGADLYRADLSFADLGGVKGAILLSMQKRMLYANMRQNEDDEWYAHIYNGCWNDGRGGTIDDLEEAVIQKYGNGSHYHLLELPYLRAWEKLELKRLQEIEK